MPRMMDIVLNLGLDDELVVGLAAKSRERFSYHSFSQLFHDICTQVDAGSCLLDLWGMDCRYFA
ncbi:hypothetical protein SOVF_095900 [Spinacia oleracea]|nr:hypothetical protein SOVF_095900 [Spinacia oleracea]